MRATHAERAGAVPSISTRAGRVWRAVAAALTAAGLAACVYVPEEAQYVEIQPQVDRPSAPLMVSKLAYLPNENTAACDIKVLSVWLEEPNGKRGKQPVYMLAGESKGEDCQTATLTLTLRSPIGRVLWRDQFTTGSLYGFENATDAAKMRGRMIDWITNYGGLNRTTRQLPSWPSGYERPDVDGGNPFLPAEDITRDEYEKIRLSRQPLYCYTSGRRAWNCLALDRSEREVRFLGVQTFKKQPAAAPARAPKAPDSISELPEGAVRADDVVPPEPASATGSTDGVEVGPLPADAFLTDTQPAKP